MSTKPAPSPGSNSASLEAVRDLIGKPLRRSQHNRLVSASSVKRWAKSIGDRKQFTRNTPEKENLPGTRGGEYNGVTIHSIRMPGRSAHHEVIMGAPGQTISLRHDTLGRDCYMPGVLRCIREVVKQQGLVVGLEKILGL